MGCSKHRGSSLNFFTDAAGILYGTAAAGAKSWSPCGTCYEVKLMPDCASKHGGYGCDINRNRRILGSGKKVYIIVDNLCPECKTGHFDFCNAGNWGGTLLGKFGGVDNPALMYRKASCPPALVQRLGCPASGPGRR